MIQFIFTSGMTLYVIIWHPFTSKVWNTSTQAWETPTAANWANYVIQINEYPGTGLYAATFPAGITSVAPYGLPVYQLNGASLSAAAPLADTFQGAGSLNWNGAAEMTPLDGTTAVPTTGNVANSLFDCLNAARAQGFGPWTRQGNNLFLYAADGSTVVRQFTLNSADTPTQRS